MACIRNTIAKNKKEVDAAIKVLKSNTKNRKKLIGLSMVPMQVPSSPQITRATYVLLCDESQCVIVELSTLIVIPKSLYEFITLSSFTFVGFEIMETIAPKLEKYGLVCRNVLEAGPSFPKTFSMLLSLQRGARNVSDTNEDSPSVVSISKAYAAFRVGDSKIGYLFTKKLIFQVPFLGLRFWKRL